MRYLPSTYNYLSLVFLPATLMLTLLCLPDLQDDKHLPLDYLRDAAIEYSLP